MSDFQEKALKHLGLDSTNPNFSITDSDIWDLSNIQAGYKICQKEYEEKLRWIQVEEDTPKVGTWILIQLKNQQSKNKYVTMLPKNDLEIAYIKENVICWRYFL